MTQAHVPPPSAPEAEPVYDYKQFAILYVDDEEKSLKYFARAFEDQFRIFTAANAKDGLSLLEQRPDEIGVLITDQRMPGEQGVWLLEQARRLRPRILRMLATAYSDWDAAVAAVNTGAIYKYISKPWDPPQLESTLKRALEFFIVQRERDQLIKEKLSVLHKVMIADRIVSLGLLAAGLSHHIRNALVAVKTFLDLAPSKLREENLDLGSLRDPDFWKDYYQGVQGQVNKIDGMLRDLWAATDAPAFAFKDPIHLRGLVAEVLMRLDAHLQAKKIVLVNQIPENLPPMLVERPRFTRMLDLLLRDEIVSLPTGSRISLTAQAEPLHAEPKTEVKIVLQDNGPGLPMEALRLMFDPFALRSDTPLEYGINLMACFLIVHHHGGRIEAASQPGQGVTFTLHMPLNPNQPPAPPETQDFLQKAFFSETLFNKLIRAG
jgi:two-component system probable response regulator PhcQ